MILNDFKKLLDDLNITYTDDMLNKLNIYCDYLMEYNEHTNLTAIRNKEDIYLKHFYDSLTVTNVINLNEIGSLLDIGSGAGFPGVVLKIFFPNLKVTILDSNNKKTTFIKLLIEKLHLSNIEVITDRAEEYAKKGNKYDVVISRAVAYIDIITTISSYLVSESGTIILMKGDIKEELSILKKYQQQLNVKDFKVYNCNLSDKDIRNIISIKINKVDNKIMSYSQIIKRHEKLIKE